MMRPIVHIMCVRPVQGGIVMAPAKMTITDTILHCNPVSIIFNGVSLRRCCNAGLCIVGFGRIIGFSGRI